MPKVPNKMCDRAPQSGDAQFNGFLRIQDFGRSCEKKAKMSSGSGSSEVGSREGDNERRGVELSSKALVVQKRRFYVDVKQNERGRFIQIVALLPVGRKSRLYMTMTIAKSLVALLEKVDLEAGIEYPKALGRLSSGKRVYFADLRENEHGKFLRLTQTFNREQRRFQIFVPVEGFDQIRQALVDAVTEFSVGGEIKLPPSQQLRDVRNKIFYFDCNSNDQGDYVRITETRYSSENRTSITVSLKNLARFHEVLGEVLKSFNELRGGDAEAEKKEPSNPEPTP